MTAEELVELYRSLVKTHLSPYVGDGWNEILSVLNRAYDIVARHVRHYESGIVLTTTTGVRDYAMGGSAFTRRLIRPIDVSKGQGRLSLITAHEFFALYGFANESGEPKTAYWRSGVFSLHPTPDQAYNDIYIIGECLPQKLSLPDDVPMLPVHTHETIAYVGAYLASEPTSTDDAALLKLKQYETKAFMDLQKARDENEELVLGSFETHEDYIS